MDILNQLREELNKNIDQKTKNSAQNFFKEKVKVYGVKTGIVRRISENSFSEITNTSKNEVFKLCEELFKSGVLEESFVACNWSFFLRDHYESDDFYIFEGWLKNYVNNWATCDTLCNHTVGTFIATFPNFLSNLKLWTDSKNRWVRRGAAVTLIIPARKGSFSQEIFAICDALLTDEDDLVQKGYGWLLKAASQSQQAKVFNYVMKNKKEMPRTALRYAIEKMPVELKAKAMEK